MFSIIPEKDRAMLDGADLDKVFRGDTVLITIYPINITPTKALKQLLTTYVTWRNETLPKTASSFGYNPLRCRQMCKFSFN